MRRQPAIKSQIHAAEAHQIGPLNANATANGTNSRPHYRLVWQCRISEQEALR